MSGEETRLEKWDICNIPAMQVYQHRNTGNDLFVRMTYSNAPLLEKLGVHYFEEDPKVTTSAGSLEPEGMLASASVSDPAIRPSDVVTVPSIATFGP